MKPTLKNYTVLFAIAVSALHCTAQNEKGQQGAKGEKAPKGEWISLTDGKTFNGWKAFENTNAWTLQEGAFVAHGNRSHLFYVGDPQPFTDFEFQAEVMTKNNSNGGIFFHTKTQPEGWPKYGFEAQVNNTYAPDPIKTGSLYQVVNMLRVPAKDDEWFKYHIKVEGKRAIVRINGVVVIDYTQPPGTKAGEDFTRVFDSGTFALQAHDPNSIVHYRKIKVRRLPAK